MCPNAPGNDWASRGHVWVWAGTDSACRVVLRCGHCGVTRVEPVSTTTLTSASYVLDHGD